MPGPVPESAPASIEGTVDIAVLISGRGSNLQALIDAHQSGRLDAPIGLVISDRSEAPGLERAARAGIAATAIPRTEFEQGEAFERALGATLDAARPRVVVLAGFMRILSADFVNRYLGRLINIHPSLLPAFRGIRANEQALAAGVETHGASVHFVIPELDAGPVIVQAEVPVKAGDNVAALADRVLTREHVILPLAVQWLVSGRCQLDGNRAMLDGRPLEPPPRLKWNERTIEDSLPTST